MRFDFNFSRLIRSSSLHFGRPRPEGDALEAARPSAAVEPEIEAEIEQLVKTPIRLLAMSELTRRFYHTYRWDGRYRSITHWLLAVATLNLVCATGDPFVVASDQVWLTLGCRFLISAAFVAGALPLRELRSVRTEGLCVLLPCAVLLLTTGILGLHQTPLLLERYLVNACFVIASGVVFLRIDSTRIGALTVITCVLTTWFIGLSPIQPVMAKTEIILFQVSAMIALWNGHRVQTRYRYRSVLLSLNNEIQARKMAELNAVLVGMTLTDPLTGIANRRHFDETLLKLEPDARIAVLMMDIDHFKRLNDTFGHTEGDRCLRLVAQVITSEVHSSDLAARYGGEEFAILARNAGPSEALAMAERIRAAVARLEWLPEREVSEGNGVPPITISIGVADGMMAEHDALLRLADRALYEAKRGGRNRVVLAHEDSGAGLQLDFFSQAA